MKKIKLFAAVAIFCAAGFSGYTAYESATMTDQERFMLKNIEALTYDIEVIIECGQFEGSCWIWDPSNILDSFINPCKWDGSPLYDC